jgi:hypothetical protein
MTSKTSIKGEIACLKFEQRALELGLIVSRPAVECEYDRVVEIDSKLYRVQLKYADSNPSNSKGAIQAGVGKTGGKRGSHAAYDPHSIDAIVVYLPKIDRLCWFNREIWSGKKMLNIRYEPAKNNQSKGCRIASDYFW